ncbi:MAG: hypothetical protein Q9207_002554 [Kuettlingeria erythrocarpa]
MSPVLRRRSQRCAIAAPPNVPISTHAEKTAENELRAAGHQSVEEGKLKSTTFNATFAETISVIPKRVALPVCPPWASKPFAKGDCFPPAIVQMVQAHQEPIIFSWSSLGAEWPPTKFPNRMSWIEGPNQTWIGCERETGLVHLNVNPSPDDSFMKHCSPGMLSARDLELIHRLQVLQNQAPTATDSEPQWCFEGFHADSEPFRPFLDAGLAPIDRDPDVIWMYERGLYRAYRISTGTVDDGVTPDLVVLASSGLTFQEYEESMMKYQGACSCYGAVNSPAVVAASWMGAYGGRCSGPLSEYDYEYVTANHHFQKQAYATGISGRFDGCDCIPTEPLEDHTLFLGTWTQFAREENERQEYQGSISEIDFTDAPATEFITSPGEECFPDTSSIDSTLPCSHRTTTTPLTDREDDEDQYHQPHDIATQPSSPSPPSDISLQHPAPIDPALAMPPPPRRSSRHNPQNSTTPLPPLPFIHLPSHSNPAKRPATAAALPALPDYGERLRALQAFNRHATATFGKISAQRQRKSSDLKGAVGNRLRRRKVKVVVDGES